MLLRAASPKGVGRAAKVVCQSGIVPWRFSVSALTLGQMGLKPLSRLHRRSKSERSLPRYDSGRLLEHSQRNPPCLATFALALLTSCVPSSHRQHGTSQLHAPTKPLGGETLLPPEIARPSTSITNDQRLSNSLPLPRSSIKLASHHPISSTYANMAAVSPIDLDVTPTSTRWKTWFSDRRTTLAIDPAAERPVLMYKQQQRPYSNAYMPNGSPAGGPVGSPAMAPPGANQLLPNQGRIIQNDKTRILCVADVRGMSATMHQDDSIGNFHGF